MSRLEIASGRFAALAMTFWIPAFAGMTEQECSMTV